VKLVDTFPFFNEEHLLVLRIKYLQDYVDKFLIMESSTTHSGHSKELLCESILRKHNLLSDKIKIINVPLPLLEEESNNWVRERGQRDYASNFIENDDIVFASDCDEILNVNFIPELLQLAISNPESIVRARMTFHQSKANYAVSGLDGNLLDWNVPFFCTKEHLVKYTLSEIREQVSQNKPELEYSNLFLGNNDQKTYVGWHFSWMGDSKQRLKKLKSFVHNRDYSSSGLGPLDSDETLKQVKNFVPYNNSTDVLGRYDHILTDIGTETLPSLLKEDHFLSNYFL